MDRKPMTGKESVKRRKDGDQDTGIMALSDDALCQIFWNLPQRFRLQSVPLTCRRFNDLLSRPDMWQTLYFGRGLTGVLQDPDSVDMRALSWLQAHSSHCQKLVIEASDLKDGTVISTLLGIAPAPKLRELVVDVPAHSWISSVSLAYIHLLRGLTRLEVSHIRSPVRRHHLDLMFSGLPHLQDCQMAFEPGVADEQPAGRAFPTALLRCTDLTRLSICSMGDRLVDWDGLPGISALQRLAVLQLQDVLTAPLAPGVGALSRLTALKVCSRMLGDIGQTPPVPQPLPDDITRLTGLRHLEITAAALPAAIAHLAGLQELTLMPPMEQAIDVEDAVRMDGLAMLSSLRNLHSLRLVACNMGHHDMLKGLDDCTALKDLQLVSCWLEKIPRLRCFTQLSRLVLAGNELCDDVWPTVLQDVPKLEALDLSCCPSLVWDTAGLAQLLQGCTSLHRVYFEPAEGAVEWDIGDRLLQLQQRVPRVRWHLSGAPSHKFLERL